MMAWQERIPGNHALPAGQVIVVEAPPGAARTAWLADWLGAAGSDATRTWLLSCDRTHAGPWAGLITLLTDLLPELEAHAPDLLTRHDYELAMILPAIRRRLSIRNPTLTDNAAGAERVRNWPADRAFRVVHGVIQLLESWHQRSGGGRWAIACDDFENAGALVRRFVAELMRRRGHQMNLCVIVTTSPGRGEELASAFAPTVSVARVRLDLATDGAAPAEPLIWAAKAEQLEQAAGRDAIQQELCLPDLIRCWLTAGRPDKALPWQAHALSVYCTQGLYADALPYGEAALAAIRRYRPDAADMRFIIVGKLFNCYAGLRRADQAEAIMTEALIESVDPNHVFRACYYLAMMHARYLPSPDFAKAEALLDRSLAAVGRTSLSEEEKLFQTVFNRNGLALIRNRQGRSDEAIALCRSGYETLEARLPAGQHQLHRSVLLYNMAQVFSATGHLDEAIQHYTAAMAMDPNYSEYYNERSGLYLRLGRFEEALRDALTAIDLSPPYAEVWCNAGQCYRAMGRLEEAVMAYSRCLDLSPDEPLALVGRAQAYEGLGMAECAIADYDRGLTNNPAQPVSLANRAVLHYEAGRLAEALADLGAAIALAPTSGELYQNRAVALRELGRSSEAARDLTTYLTLCPDADDRADVERQLLDLRGEQVIS